WDSDEAHQLWKNAYGAECWRGKTESGTLKTADAPLWTMRTSARKSMIEYLRKRYARQVAVQGASDAEIADAGRILNGDVLTLGFARRFAASKRPNLLLHDPGRLSRILSNTQRPVQLIIAGKAHPQDGIGQE